MITTLAIMEAIRAEAAKIEELKWIYFDLVPKGLERPALLIQSVASSNQDGNAGLVATTEYFALTLFDTVDNYTNSDTGSLLRLRDKVMHLFRSGYFRVAGRALRVQASNGGRDWDQAFIDLQLSFFEVRDDTPDNTPLMEEIETTVIVDGSD